MKDIKIEELEKLTIDEAMKEIQWKDSVDIREQLAMAKLLAENLLMKDENDMYMVNKNEQFILVNVAFASLYANIELAEDDYYNFDVLRRFAFNDIHHKEYDFFCLLVQNEVDFYLSQNTLEHVVSHEIGKILSSFDNTMEHVNGMLDKGDPNKIAKYLSKGVEIIANKLPDFNNIYNK